MISGYLIQSAGIPNYIWQSDYGAYELQSYKLENETFYIPVSGDRTGTPISFHSSDRRRWNFGETALKDGFRPCP